MEWTSEPPRGYIKKTFTEGKIIKELFVSNAREEDVEHPKCCFKFGKGKKVLWFEMCGHVKIILYIHVLYVANSLWVKVGKQVRSNRKRIANTVNGPMHSQNNCLSGCIAK